MAVTLTLQNVNKVGRVWKRQIQVAFSASYANSGTTGQALDLTAVVNTPKIERGVPARVPKNLGQVRVMTQPPGYVVVLQLLTTGSLATALSARVFQSGTADAALNELGNGAYAAGLTGGAGMTIEIDETN